MKASVIEQLEIIEKLYPNKIAYSDNNQEYTYSRLVEEAKSVATGLFRVVKRQQAVVVYMKKGANNIVAFMGAVYAGCYYIPIDSQMPIDRINLIIKTLNPKAIIYDDETEKSLEFVDAQAEKIKFDELIWNEKKINNEEILRVKSRAKNTDLLYVLFTSGSTGTPKGVTISHAAVIDFVEWICGKYNLNESTTLCNQAPFYFDASVPDIYIPMFTGATVYIPPKSFYTFPKKILQYIEEKKINTLIWVPSALCNVVNCQAFKVFVPTTVRLVIFCGEVMPCKHLNEWRRYIPSALYVNMYGPTEATYACMYYDITREFRDDDVLPLGKACENSEIILLTEDNQMAGEGEQGEICVLGQCLSLGYYNDFEKTSKVFIQNPLNDKYIEYMYRTGDLAFVNSSGEICFAGRKDYQIKKLGHRIELGEIENVILSMPNIGNACCVFSEESQHIVAVIAGEFDEIELKREIANKIPQYMIPDEIVKVKQLPMNINGKIDRVEIKKKYTKA